MRANVQSLEKKIAGHQTVLYSVQEQTQSMEHGMKLAQEANQNMLESIDARVEGIDESLIRTGQLGQHIMDYLNTFSAGIQVLLRSILQSNLQIYQLVLQIQQNIPSRPTNLLESNIRFEDALGEIKELPFEYFRYWEVE